MARKKGSTRDGSREPKVEDLSKPAIDKTKAENVRGGFIKLGGISGESKDSGHKDHIEISS